MKMKTMAFAALAGCIVALLLANLMITVKFANEINKIAPMIQLRRSLPCEAVPIKWATENTDCANSLLLAMNVTNLKVWPHENLSHLFNYQK